MTSLLQKIFVLIVLFPTLALAAPDPFTMRTWYHDNYTLTTKAFAPVDGYDHSLAYEFPGGFASETQFCKLASPNHLECITHDKVTFDPNTYAVTLDSPQGSAIYYDSPRN